MVLAREGEKTVKRGERERKRRGGKRGKKDGENWERCS